SGRPRRLFTDLGHDHVHFVPVSAANIRDMCLVTVQHLRQARGRASSGAGGPVGRGRRQGKGGRGRGAASRAGGARGGGRGAAGGAGVWGGVRGRGAGGAGASSGAGGRVGRGHGQSKTR